MILNGMIEGFWHCSDVATYILSYDVNLEFCWIYNYYILWIIWWINYAPILVIISWVVYPSWERPVKLSNHPRTWCQWRANGLSMVPFLSESHVVAAAKFVSSLGMNPDRHPQSLSKFMTHPFSVLADHDFPQLFSKVVQMRATCPFSKVFYM